MFGGKEVSPIFPLRLLLDHRHNRACVCHIMQKYPSFYLLNFRLLFLGEYLEAFYLSLFFFSLLYPFLAKHIWSLNCQHTITNISAAIAACMHACNTAASTYLLRFNFQQLEIW